MEHYKNLGGDSGVVAYKIEVDSITVKFKDGWHYLYDHAHTGSANIEQMKKLAVTGKGLNSLISSVIKKAFNKKWK